MTKKLDSMDLKQIISLHIDKYSNRAISNTLGISRNTINNYIQLFSYCDKDMHELLKLDESCLEELFSSKKTLNSKPYLGLKIKCKFETRLKSVN
jgi:predicted AAA+ superfamily ATPase